MATITERFTLLMTNAVRQSNNSKREANALAVVGSALCDLRLYAADTLVLLFREASSGASDARVGWDSYHGNCDAVATKAAPMVLDDHQHLRGRSCRIDFSCSLDDRVGPCRRDYSYWCRRSVFDARDSFRCEEIRGSLENL